MLSNSCRRMLLDGSRNSYPFCGMYTISLPSMDRSFFPFGKVFPQKDILPETRLTFPGSTPMIDCAINVLPDPVSPMRAKLSPGKIWKETPQTSSFSVRSSFAATTPLLYCKIGFSKFPSESTFLHSPARKNYVRFLMKRCAIALGSGRNMYNHILI